MLTQSEVNCAFTFQVADSEENANKINLINYEIIFQSQVEDF